jgi:hypothetical protein
LTFYLLFLSYNYSFKLSQPAPHLNLSILITSTSVLDWKLILSADPPVAGCYWVNALFTYRNTSYAFYLPVKPLTWYTIPITQHCWIAQQGHIIFQFHERIILRLSIFTLMKLIGERLFATTKRLMSSYPIIQRLIKYS